LRVGRHDEIAVAASAEVATDLAVATVFDGRSRQPVGVVPGSRYVEGDDPEGDEEECAESDLHSVAGDVIDNAESFQFETSVCQHEAARLLASIRSQPSSRQSAPIVSA
jgi:hypothetical protein